MAFTNSGPSTTTTVNTEGLNSNFYKLQVLSVALTPALIAQGTTAEQAFTSLGTGIKAGDMLLSVVKPTTQAGLGIVGFRVDAAVDDKFYITYANVPGAGGNITPTAAETYQLLIARPMTGSTLAAVA